MKIIRSCALCGTFLEHELDGRRFTFEAHTDAFCRAALRLRIESAVWETCPPLIVPLDLPPVSDPEFRVLREYGGENRIAEPSRRDMWSWWLYA